MRVAIIVRENLTVTETLKKQLKEIVTNLVVDAFATNFLFNGIGEFDTACYEIVTNLKKVFPELQREFYTPNREFNGNEVEYYLTLYEKINLTNKSGGISYDMRDQVMVDKCDILVTYCDLDREQSAKWTSSTARTIAYAWKEKKRIVNLFEYKNFENSRFLCLPTYW